MFQREHFWINALQHDSLILTWHGVHLSQPDWSDDSHSLAFSLHDPLGGDYLHIILNAYWEPLTFELPPLPVDQRWHRLIDTAQPCPRRFHRRPIKPARWMNSVIARKADRWWS